MEYLTMTPKEVNRCGIIKKLLNKEINSPDAARLLKLSLRQTKRLKAKAKQGGLKALIHAGRGKPSNRKIPSKEREAIANIIKRRYHDFKPTFASEKLAQNHNIKRDPKTIRRIMIDEYLWTPKKKKQKEYHSWRQRKACYGEMLQFDGSYHHWVEDRGPEWCLLAAIDDATGIPVEARFDFNEGVIPVFQFWKEYEVFDYFRYVDDKFSTYKMNQRAAIENHDTETQFQRAMRQLGIEPITAHSPQAKGRIERLFNTFQDRLVKEMRLTGVKTCEEANAFLEKYLDKFNAKFAVVAQLEGDMHRPLNKRIKIDEILSVQTEHVLRNDRTVVHERKLYQVTDKTRAQRVVVFEYLNGRMAVKYGQTKLGFKTIDQRPHRELEPQKIKKTKKRQRYIPPRDSHWRAGFKLKGSPCFQN